LCEPELLHVETDGPVDVRYEQHWPRKPFIAHDVLLPARRDRLRSSANSESAAKLAQPGISARCRHQPQPSTRSLGDAGATSSLRPLEKIRRHFHRNLASRFHAIPLTPYSIPALNMVSHELNNSSAAVHLIEKPLRGGGRWELVEERAWTVVVSGAKNLSLRECKGGEGFFGPKNSPQNDGSIFQQSPRARARGACGTARKAADGDYRCW
jgi:hypothetical protein